MKCFISGRSSNFDEICRVTHLVRSAGHQISHDWTVLPMVKPYSENQDRAGEYAKQQIQGIIDADACIFLAHHDGTGLFAELGAALAVWQLQGKLLIYAVSREIPEAMFHYHPAIVWKESVEEVLAELLK